MTTSKQAKLRRTSSSRTRTASWFTGGDRFCGRDAGKCKPGRDDPESHAQIRLGVKNCTRSAVDCGLPDLYIEMPPTRVGHDMDGLMGTSSLRTPHPTTGRRNSWRNARRSRRHSAPRRCSESVSRRQARGAGPMRGSKLCRRPRAKT
jgi:hypothetical protein